MTNKPVRTLPTQFGVPATLKKTVQSNVPLQMSKNIPQVSATQVVSAASTLTPVVASVTAGYKVPGSSTVKTIAPPLVPTTAGSGLVRSQHVSNTLGSVRPASLLTTDPVLKVIEPQNQTSSLSRIPIMAASVGTVVRQNTVLAGNTAVDSQQRLDTQTLNVVASSSQPSQSLIPSVTNSTVQQAGVSLPTVNTQGFSVRVNPIQAKVDSQQRQHTQSLNIVASSSQPTHSVIPLSSSVKQAVIAQPNAIVQGLAATASQIRTNADVQRLNTQALNTTSSSSQLNQTLPPTLTTSASLKQGVVAQPSVNAQGFAAAANLATLTTDLSSQQKVLTALEQLNLPFHQPFLQAQPVPVQTQALNKVGTEAAGQVCGAAQLHLASETSQAISTSASSIVASMPQLKTHVLMPSASTAVLRTTPRPVSLATSEVENTFAVQAGGQPVSLATNAASPALLTNFPAAIHTSNSVAASSSLDVQSQISELAISVTKGTEPSSTDVPNHVDFLSSWSSSVASAGVSTSELSSISQVAFTCASTFSPLSPIMSANTLNSLLNIQPYNQLPIPESAEFGGDTSCGYQPVPQILVEPASKESDEADFGVVNPSDNTDEIVLTTTMFSSRPKAAGSGYGLGNDFEELFAQMLANQGSAL